MKILVILAVLLAGCASSPGPDNPAVPNTPYSPNAMDAHERALGGANTLSDESMTDPVVVERFERTILREVAVPAPAATASRTRIISGPIGVEKKIADEWSSTPAANGAMIDPSTGKLIVPPTPAFEKTETVNPDQLRRELEETRRRRSGREPEASAPKSTTTTSRVEPESSTRIRVGVGIRIGSGYGSWSCGEPTWFRRAFEN
ncbi:MAG: hypothetical protein COU10_01815 [Candidatus Harrisonbacteria bacterium CG10_big_fil_rev_8_21_14_0_10_45_28]|uniref:Uncharacterized protein n=1 Tax=Candidatus Harrisonbacteria bacterium CG10_big_fil_rev_8_21_14_0_10_45_28 TaxID=1974586 RepID=A0A2H0UNF8_9BACT|nr:MAG: hypothetical protein COU10_01815 [Candidatus Harrisonbacteria bacterium CG10_big_fil_rev_8_21_14_0_10_45_28]